MINIIFDMDGVMFDTERVYALAWDYAGEKAGIGKAGFMNELTLGMNEEKSREVWRQYFGEDYDEVSLKFYSREFLRRYYEENPVPEKAGLRELLGYLRENGAKIGLASSTPIDEVRRNLRSAGIEEYFDAAVGGDEVFHSKPDPEIYIKVCGMLGAEPENCYAVEDSKSGIISACGAGCKVIMVPDLWECDRKTEWLLHAKLDSLLDVRDFLENESGSAPEADFEPDDELSEILF